MNALPLFGLSAVLVWISARQLTRAFGNGDEGHLIAGIVCGLVGLAFLLVASLRAVV
jgi:hypothetical protein